jgi:S-adenosylmethionine synthetase
LQRNKELVIMKRDRRYFFTSESVSEGHPDKICDQISDAVLDACLRDDPKSHVACESFTTTGLVLIGGEITTETYVNLQDVVRGVVRRIGYDKAEYGLDYESMAVMDTIHSQSADIALGVNEESNEFKSQGAGDQGMMFGYACRETEELMPAPIMYAHKLLLKAAEVRKEGKVAWMRPDGKSQVTIEYDHGIPKRVDTIVMSQQHNAEVTRDQIEEDLKKHVIQPVMEETGLVGDGTKFFINPTGRFVIGGPHGDSGLTGRKIVVDTYGGMGRHGGGAFSGKDPSKVDRSATYMARYIAKNLVASEVCERCEVELAYAIGVPFPVSIMVDTFDTNQVDEAKIEKAVEQVFDLSPAGLIKTLDLLQPIYEKTAAYGHFGRDDFTWEQTDKVDELKRVLG